MKTNKIAEQVKLLTKENVRLYEENMKLKLMLGHNEDEKKEKTITRSRTRKNINKKVSKPSHTNLSKFQREREEKKSIVLKKRTEKMPVPEIAKLIKQSEPTVRNYIRELRVEGRLAK